MLTILLSGRYGRVPIEGPSQGGVRAETSEQSRNPQKSAIYSISDPFGGAVSDQRHTFPTQPAVIRAGG